MIRLAIVSPCYNEEEVLPQSAQRLLALLDDLAAKGKITPDSYILFVNDGSRDATWSIIRRLHDGNPRIHGLSLARNSGHQNAILAGMLDAARTADAVVTVDADLQDDITAIEKMVDDHARGIEVVYGVKVSRKADPVFKRLTATAFYRFQREMGVNAIFNHADFRLMSRSVIERLARYGERNIYLRGIIPLLSSATSTVDDVISERTAGTSKYTLSKMLSLAIDGITSFSVKPIYSIIYAGGIFLVISLLIGIYVIVSLLSGNAEHGWASMMLSIGVVGIYIGRIYIEVKHRPRYHIGERTDGDQGSEDDI